MEEQNLSLAIALEYFNAVWKKRWMVLFVTIVGGFITIPLVLVLPDVYESYTLIFVERQQVPESYVKSAVTGDVADRMNTIKQQIMSRTNITRIIKEFRIGETPEENNKYINKPRLAFLDMKKKIKLTLHELFGITEKKKKPDLDNLIKKVSSKITVSTQGSGNNISSFKIAYKGENPEQVMKITDKLASLFIEENLKFREQMVEGTSGFLEHELRIQEQVLSEKEQAISEFKSKNMGSLPSQLQTNLHTLSRTQQELASASENLIMLRESKFQAEQTLMTVEEEFAKRQAALMEKKEALLQKRKEALQLQQSLNSANNVETVLDTELTAPKEIMSPLEMKVLQLREYLAQLRAEYKDTYPDIILLKSQLAQHEKELALQQKERQKQQELSLALLKEAAKKQKSDAEADKNSKAADNTKVSPEPDPGIAVLEVKDEELLRLRDKITALKELVASFTNEINTTTRNKAALMSKMKEYSARVEKTPALEQELTLLTRDYSNIKNTYEDLLNKKLNAKISENLEKRQKGEQLRIIDNAFLPIKPIKPNRLVLIIAGWGLSFSCGVGFIILRESVSNTFKKPEDFDKLFDLQFVVSIPYIEPKAKWNSSKHHKAK